MLARLAWGEDPDFDSIRQMIPYVGRHTAATPELAGGGRLIKSHEKCTFPYSRRYNQIVYLVRDGRDVAVSYYVYYQRAGFIPGMSFSDFLEMFLSGRLDGYGSWQQHVLGWLSFNGRRCVVRYEDLRGEPVENLTRVAEFLGVPSANAGDAVEAQRLDAMQDREQRKSVASPQTMARRGVVGGWREQFSVVDEARFLDRGRPALEACGYL